MYDVLCQRTLRILLRREALQEVGKCSEKSVRCSFRSLRECIPPKCGELGLSRLSICEQRSAPVGLINLYVVFLHDLGESVSGRAANVFWSWLLRLDVDRKLGSSFGRWVGTTEEQRQYVLLADCLQKLGVFDTCGLV
jgi:hypothetical protein